MTHPRFVQIIQAVDSLCALDENGRVWSYQPIRDDELDIVGMEWKPVNDVKIDPDE